MIDILGHKFNKLYPSFNYYECINCKIKAYILYEQYQLMNDSWGNLSKITCGEYLMKQIL